MKVSDMHRAPTKLVSDPFLNSFFMRYCVSSPGELLSETAVAIPTLHLNLDDCLQRFVAAKPEEKMELSLAYLTCLFLIARVQQDQKFTMLDTLANLKTARQFVVLVKDKSGGLEVDASIETYLRSLPGVCFPEYCITFRDRVSKVLCEIFFDSDGYSLN